MDWWREIESVKYGEVPEWTIGTVLKTVVPERVPGVRIPPSPPTKKQGQSPAFVCGINRNYQFPPPPPPFPPRSSRGRASLTVKVRELPPTSNSFPSSSATALSRSS